MKYKVNEIFYSLQGEGYWTGTPMVFVRLSGCNLKCPWCDTSHESGAEMTADEIVDAVNRANTGGVRRICLTGGEPLLQVDAPLLDALHAHNYLIHIETNGTLPRPAGLDWVTMSPKGRTVLDNPDEIKVVFEGGAPDLSKWEALCGNLFLQPCDTGDPAKNSEILNETIYYVKQNARWRLSLQTHKIINIR
jgi:organic radical activating enzyme